MMSPEAFGTMLKAARINQQLTISRLADMTGVSQPYLSQIENGKGSIPSPDILNKLHLVLDFKYTHLLRLAGYLPEVDDPEEMDNRKEPYNEFIITDLAALLRKSDTTYNNKMLSQYDRKMINALIETYLANKMVEH